MSDDNGGNIFEMVLGVFSLLGASLHWCVFLGKKSFSKTMESEFLNGVIGFLIILILFFAFKNKAYELIIYLINKRLKS